MPPPSQASISYLEGWFSCVYLNLTAYLSEGHFIEDSASIYDMIFHILLDPLPSDYRKLLTFLGLADEFTGSQAVYLWKNDSAREMLKNLTENNAFISRLPEPDTFRCHHMLKSCTRKMFDELPIEEQNRCKARMGTWYQSQGRYEEAIHWLSLSDNYEALLNAVEENRGYALNIQHQEEVLRWLDECPKATLAAIPTPFSFSCAAFTPSGESRKCCGSRTFSSRACLKIRNFPRRSAATCWANER